MAQIYHNPKCSKSRQTLALLKEHGIDPEEIHYLQDPPDAQTLKTILQQLGITARELLRTGEQEYKDLGLADQSLTEDALIEAMTQHPKLIQRPIVVHQGKAKLGRPPEDVLALFS